MNQLLKSTNDYCKLLRLFINNYHAGWSMRDASKIGFHKAQTRLGELEKSLDKEGVPRTVKLKIRRLKLHYAADNGKLKSYLNYKSIAPKSYLVNLHNCISKKGL